MAKTEKNEKINLRHRVECTVTKKGADFKHNSWKEGQVIKCAPALAEKFEKDGLVKITGQPIDPKPVLIQEKK